MPIVNVTDKPEAGESYHLGYPMLAKLYKGDPKVDTKRPGKDRETFRVKFNPPFDTPDIQAAWTALYGAEPRELDWVFLFGTTPEAVFPTWLEEWSKTAMLHRCNGVTQERHYIPATMKYSDMPTPCACMGKDKPSCQRVGRLNLWLPAFMKAIGVKGYVALSTHSLIDIIEIDQTVKALFRDYGAVMTVPLVFGRAPREISTPREGGRVTATKSLLYLRPMAHVVQQTAARIESGQGASLPAPAPAPSAPATAPQLPATTAAPSIWTDETKQRARTWIVRNFGLNADAVIARLKQPFTDFATTDAWQNAIKATIRREVLPVIVRGVEVKRIEDAEFGEIAVYDLVTAIGQMRIKGGVAGGVSSIVKRLGEDTDAFLEAYHPEVWEAGKTYTFETPVWVDWQVDGDALKVERLMLSEPRLPDLHDEDVEAEFEEVQS